ncbi:uncharacterized protein LOC128203048 isoform X2 [Mya arenaria]|uniref:uncharacterized protein LOC128203048 isoform X2 n=1 Tax=Mya arenaria TaxID=6604 RepID=UPI0022E0AF9B|nr:uncharacterized protein LOC128203048 isoform X2 [Mya arenaria]
MSRLNKTTDSEDDVTARASEDSAQRRKLNTYFLVLKRRSSMAMRADNSVSQNGGQFGENCRSFLKRVTMSDLAIPDHVGQLTDQSENKKVWGVVLDMLFCVFDDEKSEKPRDVIVLPGCNIRPLVYKSAINGVHNNSQTVSGISKFQFVIDDCSSSRKYIFGVESQQQLDIWYKVLQKASTLDPEMTNDISTSNGRESPLTLSPRRLSLDENMYSTGYFPSQDSPNRKQKLSSPRSSESLDTNVSTDDSSVSGSSHVTCQPSPRGTPGMMRNEGRRQSIQDFKKKLRREHPEPEVSKHQPIRAMHFESKQADDTPHVQPEKKMKAFGSLENLLKFTRKKRKSQSEDSVSNDSSSIVSSNSASTENDFSQASRSVDISAQESKMGKKKNKRMSRSLEFKEPKNGVNSGIVRRASDIKDRVFSRRPSKKSIKLGDLQDLSMQGYLHNKHHLKWQKLWCVVCRGCFYGFKSQSADDTAQLSVLLANCAVVYVSEKDKRQKHIYIFKLTRERSKSIYLCTYVYTDLMKWLTVLQMESNSVISNVDNIRRPSESENESICSSLSSQSSSMVTMSSAASALANEQQETSRSRSKTKKKAPPKPPRHSSCPPPLSRDSGTSTGEETLTSGSMSATCADEQAYKSQDDLPRYDKAVAHVWQNDRGYLFNAIRAKMTAYGKRKPETIYNKELPGTGNEGLLVVQDGGERKSRDVRRTRSFNVHSAKMSPPEERDEVDAIRPTSPTSTPESPSTLRKRHKPLVVKKVDARELVDKQSIAGYLERKSVSAQWIRYWFVLHEGTLFCYLTADDNVTVDVLNLHGYTVTSLVDKFRGKRFVLQLSHENFTSLHISFESREEMESWDACLNEALDMQSSRVSDGADSTLPSCSECTSNRDDEVGEKRKQVKQKLLEEMLRQKHELEKKQAQRQKKQGRISLDSPERQTLPEFTLEDQRTSDVTRLKQRRMSTQLKVDTIQKQIEKPSGTKRGLFSFGKTKKVDENKNEYLQDQIKELNEKLHKIDTDLNHVGSDKYYDSFDVNQNKKNSSGNMPSQLMTSLLMTSDRPIDSDDENGRSKTIKSAVQKWTNKTFAAKKKPNSNGKPSLNGSLPNMAMKYNGDINLNGDSEPETDTCSGEYLESSVTDLTRPLADLKLSLNLPLSASQNSQNSSNGSCSPSLIQYNRSTSRTSTASSLSSPRREINPSVLAEIDAFEELTKQVLGARSRDVTAK